MIFFHYFHSDIISVNQKKEGTLRKASNETEQLRQQVSKLNRQNDNALAENRFVYLLMLSFTLKKNLASVFILSLKPVVW